MRRLGSAGMRTGYGIANGIAALAHACARLTSNLSNFAWPRTVGHIAASEPEPLTRKGRGVMKSRMAQFFRHMSAQGWLNASPHRRLPYGKDQEYDAAAPWPESVLLAAAMICALTCTIMVRPANAQTEVRYTEAVKPAFLRASLPVPPAGHYESVEAAFAAAQAWQAASCAANPSYACVVYDELQLCPNQVNYFWGEPSAWCWRWTRTEPNGTVSGQGITGSISITFSCPTSPAYASVTNLVSGTGQVGSPRYYENRCELTRVAILPCNPCAGNPIHPASGTKYQREQDYASGDGMLTFTRHYDSAYGRFRHEYDVDFVPPNQKTGLATIRGVISVYNSTTNTFTHHSQTFQTLNLSAHSTKSVLTTFIGARDELNWNGTTGASTSPYFKTRLIAHTVNGAPGWLMTRPDENRLMGFDIEGRLQFVQRTDGRLTTLSHVGGQLSTVSDNWGRTLQIGHDQNGVASVVDPAGQPIGYAYSDISKLTSVTYQDGSSKSYVWDESTWSTGSGVINRLTGIVDESSTRFASFGYTNGKAVSTQHAGNVDRFSISDTRSGGWGNVTETGPLGTVRTTYYGLIGGFSRPIQISQPAGAGSSASSMSISYDTSGNVTRRADYKGNVTCFGNDTTRNVETVRVEGLANNATCAANLSAYAIPSNTRQRKISTQYHPQWNFPIGRAGPRKITSWIYNGQPDGSAGGAIAQCAPTGATLADGTPIAVLCKRIEQPTTDDTGTLGFSAQADGSARAWSYTYNSFGQVITADGPRTDVSDITTYTYYTCNTGYGCGQVHTVTNALGHTTTYNNYNAHGQPLTITDPNGAVTTLTYDLRQRLTSRSVGSEVTSFEYWPAGLLKKATLPDGSYLLYTYDAAHRLTDITDAEGNRIHYTLDAMGNRTAEESFDTSNVLFTTRTRVFDALNRLWKEIGAPNTANVTTAFGYDNNGNQTTTTAPLSRNTGQGYDELNRLTSVTDPASGLTQYGYNALDQLLSVTDPRGKVTSYTYNALGDLTQQVSPDTGTTTNTYDSGGNVATRTDARSKTGTYSYDALNRVTQLSYPDQTITYTYDTGTNQKGRLTGLSDASGSTSWSYDSHGRVTNRTLTMGSLSKSVDYSYDAYGRLQTLTLPSGNTVTYGYTNGRVTSLTLNGSTTILSNVLYQPFGPTLGWTWGNSTLAVREYDQDGKITDIDSAGLKSYGYDDAFRITGITDASTSSLSQSYGYDLLDRLTSATGTGFNQSWTYDANGNRLTQGGAQASTYTVSSTSNRLSSVTGALSRTYSYDAAGNITGDGSATFTYDDAGRMVSVTKASVTTTYQLNALGQRVRKTTASNSTYFVYDEAGYLLGEYDNAGNLGQETVWLGEIPVAVLKPNGGGVSVFYVHSDHLNTPRRISRPSDNAIVWRWDGDPFGTVAASEDPDGDSTLFAYHLRFPGQYFDSETGLHYNYFRDYDPAIGRYVQSDPIGLAGGLNTYMYVGADPISLSDPSGLFAPALVVPAVEGAITVIGGLVAVREAHRIKEENDIKREAANDPDFDDKGCPPDCRAWRAALNRMYHAINKLSSVRGVSPAYVELRWEQFRVFVKRYEQFCGPYTPPPSFFDIYTK